jgi:prepilin-type N-terminal cleavage/methylation domain-containing protein
MKSCAKPQAAFTLLEMVLALAIGVLLLTGLYFALDMHLMATTAGRSQVDQAQIARNVLKNLQGDFKEQIATLDAYPSANASSSSAASTTGTTSTTSSTSSTGANASSTAATSNPMTYTLPNGLTTPTFPFNLGVQGETDWCAIYISRVPKAVVQAQNSDPTLGGGAQMQAVDSDLRRVTYWLNSTSGTSGLARQDVVVVTSDDTNMSNLPPPGVDDMTTIVAPEVVGISFQYFDGTNWQASWDGTQFGTDGVTPIGPPVAIQITLKVARTDKLHAGADDPTVRTYTHVIQIPTASFYTNWPNNTLNPLAVPQAPPTTGG